MKTSRTLLGEAAEHLVCADLMLKGKQAILVSGHCYDVLVDDGKLTRIQVKSSRKSKGKYQFATGGAGNRPYGTTIDMYAFVFWDEVPKIRYAKKPRSFTFKEIPEKV